MKKILSLVLTLTLVFAFIALGQAQVSAEVPANDCETDKTVIIHYKRWDDDYTDGFTYTPKGWENLLDEFGFTLMNYVAPKAYLFGKRPL